MRILAGAGAVAVTIGALVWWQFAGADPMPPYPSPTEVAALEPMDLPQGWMWNGNVSSGGPPDGKTFGLDMDIDTRLWQGDRISPDHARALLAVLTRACTSREFATSLVQVRERWDDMQDMTYRQLVARVTWESAPQGTQGRSLQTFEAYFAWIGGVCGEVHPQGLIDSPHHNAAVWRWIIY